MIDWINSNSGIIQSISAIVMIFLTGFYVLFTKSILKANEGVYEEAEKSRELANMPNVIAYFDMPAHNVLNFNIKNIGINVAKNTHIEIEYLNEITKENELKKSYILQNGVATLAPGQKLEMFYGSLLELKSAQGDFPKINVHLVFEDSHGKQYRLSYTLDANVYKGIGTIRINGIHHLTKTFAEFQNDFSKMSQDIRGYIESRQQEETD
ncbi:hypothetical protein [Paenibacillus ehimensis]|uniref:hypothetical protein n=1 Tax=Paenibacillus ehimensis TaxID=79264 RepID=UPI000FDAE1E8|nr:hypothetical protein [Paenibacillus ehimensis]